MNGDGASAADVVPVFVAMALVLFGLAWLVVRSALGPDAVARLGRTRLAASVALAFLVGPAALLLDVGLLHGVIRFRLKDPAAGGTVVAITLIALSRGWAYATHVLLRVRHS
jgi:hypothetical protein